MSSAGTPVDQMFTRKKDVRSASPVSMASSSADEDDLSQQAPATQQPPRQLTNVLAAFADAGVRSRKRADTQASVSSSRSRRVAAAAKESYPSTPEFRELDRVLKRVTADWPMISPEDDEQQEFDLVTLALRLLDDQRALDSFLRRKTELTTALKAIIQKNYKAFDASVGAYNLAGTSLTGAQKEVGSLRHELDGIKDVLARKAKELGQMEMKRDECAEAERILDTMSVSLCSTQYFRR
jgi:hypothetical protein